MVNYNRPPVLKKISFIFTGIVIILLLLIVYYFFGRVTITVTPNIKAVTTTFEISVKTEVDATDGSMMPGDIFTNSQSTSQLFSVAEMTEEIPGRAKGKISIINNNSSDQILVETTRFLTPENILFRLDDQVTIPRGSQIIASITADQAGIEGDIKPPLRLTIPGLSQPLQQRIYGQVEELFSGGIIKRGYLAETDLMKAHDTLKRQIEEEFQVNYLSEYFANITTTTPSVVPDLFANLQIDSVTVDAEVGDLVNEFTYSLITTIEGVAIKKSDLEVIAQSKLKSSLGASEQFIGITPGSFSIKPKEIDTINQIALLEISIAGQSIYTEASSIVDKSKLIGKNEADLISFFSQISGVESIAVNFSPLWVQQVPRIKKNIKILIEDVR